MSQQSNGTSRRDFLKTSAVVGGTVAAGLSLSRGAHAAEDNTLKVGVVGCGGRGTGAVVNALKADPNTKLVAMGDAFEDRLTNSLNSLKNNAAVGERIAVDPENIYTGLDAYKGVIASGADVIILTTPPQFRPEHLRACVEAGKHTFVEKPVAVDAKGVRSVLETCKKAKEKNLNIVSGLCWRYDTKVKATMDRILSGDIGDVVSIEVRYLAGKLWTRPAQEGDTEMMTQVRNWYNFAWLSGDFQVEQHVHSLDKALWAMGDVPPIACYGLGGRLVRTEQPAYGDIYDHGAAVFEYPNGKKVYYFGRQMNGCFGGTKDEFIGTKGTACVLNDFATRDYNGETTWSFNRQPREILRSLPSGSMYDLEHVALFNAIRSGDTINNGEYMSYSTLLGIMAREVAYTGQRITWDEMMNSQKDMTLDPANYSWDADPVLMPLDAEGHYPICRPGDTKFI